MLLGHETRGEGGVNEKYGGYCRDSNSGGLRFDGI